MIKFEVGNDPFMMKVVAKGLEVMAEELAKRPVPTFGPKVFGSVVEGPAVEGAEPSEDVLVPSQAPKAGDSVLHMRPTGGEAAPLAEEPEDSVVSGADVDSAGVPWDSRIHSGSQKTLAKSGQWKKKRYVSPEVVEKVEAELLAARPALAGQTATPSAAPPPPPPVPGTEGAPAPPVSFMDLLRAITDRAISPDVVAKAASHCGLGSLIEANGKDEIVSILYGILINGEAVI